MVHRTAALDARTTSETLEGAVICTGVNPNSYNPAYRLLCLYRVNEGLKKLRKSNDMRVKTLKGVSKKGYVDGYLIMNIRGRLTLTRLEKRLRGF
jgi:hypothetical protein